MNPTSLLKKLLIGLVVIILLALDWAALHDIIKGEANQTLEYLTVAFSLAVFAMLFFSWLRSRNHTAMSELK